MSQRKGEENPTESKVFDAKSDKEAKLSESYPLEELKRIKRKRNVSKGI